MEGFILIVEDDLELRIALREALEDEGYRVQSAADGLEAFRLLQGEPKPSLIILDLRMPVMDGFTFRKQQLANPALASIPVACLSASDSLEPSEGLIASLTKPIELSDLLAVVGGHMKVHP